MSETKATAQIEPICDEFDRSWARGDRPDIKGILDRVPEALRGRLVCELILIDCEWRRKNGESPHYVDYASRFPELADDLKRLFPDADAGHVEKHLLFAVLAFECDLIDLAQLTAACRAWVANKLVPLADLLVQRGWLTATDREFLDKQLERKLAKHRYDTRLTLNVVTRGDVCDVLKELADPAINQSLSSWPSGGPVLVETISKQSPDSQQSQSRYTWVSEVGKGGLGRVWLARDNEMVREVALKEIKPGSESNEAIRRLIKEAQITGQLQHPNIVPVYEMNRGGRPFYTMKLVKGETRAQAIKRHHQQFGVRSIPDDAITPNHTLVPPAAWDRYDESRTAERGASESLSMQRLMSVFLNVCDALAYAHSRGIVHRDLKPQNIVLGDYGEAIVLDWGLARRLDQKDDDAASVRFTADADTEATQQGAVIGSLPYMASEQAGGQTDLIDQRTDVYGLGAILFAILTDRAPHLKDYVASYTSFGQWDWTDGKRLRSESFCPWLLRGACSSGGSNRHSFLSL